MAILEINLEKPALLEEYQYPGETTAKSGESPENSGATEPSSGGKAKLLALLAVVAGVGLLVWKLTNRGDTEQADLDEFEGEGEYEHGPEPEIGGDESGGAKRKVAGILGFAVAVVGLVGVVRKRRS
ncbi:hypothetical protein [Halorussus caseinilyticus]|uniref:PGF-CTERM sorting domain-containing protein n=1 Tax=Halorussus caseinilyticus TaxID=3034025 RepID=A0ABD5WP98_9EURY|nr:hypothetical protein [Halorussus sp. DT72]